MHVLAVICALAFISLVLLDAFQTIILPRRPTKRLRITRLFFLATWTPWVRMAGLAHQKKTREQMYSVFGPLSLLFLFALWAVLLMSGFALLYFGLHMPFVDPMHPASTIGRLRSCFYISGTTLFTLGLGDVLPATHAARALLIVESGMGLAYLGLVIGYVPVLYNTFSHREVSVALLDARAGSPPTAGELLVRHGFDGGRKQLEYPARGVGALGGRGARDPCLVSHSLLLPLAARQPELAGGGHHHPGYLCLVDHGGAGREHAAG